MIQKKYSSSLSRQSNKTKPNTELVLVSQEPLLYLELNKPNKQNVSEINLFKKLNFLKMTVDANWCQEWNATTSLLIIN